MTSRLVKKMSVSLVVGLLLVVSMFAQQVKHVLLVSIDGFRPDFYKDASWPAPTLQALKKNGVYAEGVKSVFPSVTYPSHTTIITGAFPAVHGIYYNVPFGESDTHWYWEDSAIRTPTLWTAVRNAGLRSGSVMWPVTVGAPIDYNFPVRRADNDEKVNQLQVTLPFVTPANLIDEIRSKENGFPTAVNFNEDSIDITIGKLAAYILQTKQPNLLAVHFIGVDHAAHVNGRDAQPVRNAVATVDSMLHELLSAIKTAGLENSTAIIITGDHGFADTKDSFSPNVLLEQNGLLGEAQFITPGGSAFLYLKNKQDGGTLKKIMQILDELPAEEKKHFRVVDRAELDRIGANPEVAMALAFRKGTVGKTDSKGPLVKLIKKGGSHGYFPEFDEINTGFIAIGPGIQKSQKITTMGIQDIAPLIAQLLNLPFKAVNGNVIPGILNK